MTSAPYAFEVALSMAYFVTIVGCRTLGLEGIKKAAGQQRGRESLVRRGEEKALAWEAMEKMMEACRSTLEETKDKPIPKVAMESLQKACDLLREKIDQGG